MTLLSLIVVLLIVGILLWGLGQMPMIDPTIKKVITVIVLVVLALWILTGFLGEGSFNPRLW